MRPRATTGRLTTCRHTSDVSVNRVEDESVVEFVASSTLGSKGHVGPSYSSSFST